MRATSLLLQATLAAASTFNPPDNVYSIQYICQLGGGIGPNDAQAASGCRDSEFVEASWLGELRIGSAQNGSKIADSNPWDFAVSTTSNLIGGSGLEVWDWEFSSAGQTLDTYTFGDEQILDLTKNGSVSHKDFAGVQGFVATGDQSGYLGHASDQNSARVELAASQCGLGSEPVHVKWDNTTQFKWELSFTNSTANFSLITSQSFGNLTLSTNCFRMLNESPFGLHDVPYFTPEPVELLTNGSGPLFHNWNLSKSYPAPSSLATRESAGPAALCLGLLLHMMAYSW